MVGAERVKLCPDRAFLCKRFVALQAQLLKRMAFVLKDIYGWTVNIQLMLPILWRYNYKSMSNVSGNSKKSVLITGG